MTATLEQLRAEHASQVIGPELSHLLERIVRATAVTYPPVEYSDAGVWNREAFEDALHDWVEIRLLTRGDLTVMLASAASVTALRAALTRSFGQFLINRRRRTAASNLYKRTLAKLRTDERFLAVSSSARAHEVLWTLAATPVSEPSSLPLEELIALAFKRSDAELGVVRYGPHSLKSSPILREPQLADFLLHLLEGAQGALSMAAIAEVMRYRFNLVAPAPVELDEALVSPELSIPARVEQQEIARSVLSRLDFPQLEMLRTFVAAGDLQEAATSLHVDVQQVASTVSEVLGMIADYAESADEARSVFNQLTESLFE
jgi:hypothetical protein